MKNFNPYEKEGYKKPSFPNIRRFFETEKLYEAENNLYRALDLVAKRFHELYKERTTYQKLWEEVYPEILARILSRYDPKAAELAAIGYLERQGYNIEK